MPDYSSERVAEWFMFIVLLVAFWPLAVVMLIVIIMAENTRNK